MLFADGVMHKSNVLMMNGFVQMHKDVSPEEVEEMLLRKKKEGPSSEQIVL